MASEFDTAKYILEQSGEMDPIKLQKLLPGLVHGVGRHASVSGGFSGMGNRPRLYAAAGAV